MKRFIPLYRSDDYESFRQLMSSHDSYLPATYDEWLKRVTKEVAHVTAQGVLAKMVLIDPDEFTKYCDTTRMAYNLVSADLLAAEKGAANH